MQSIKIVIKLVAKLFFVLVELARFLVASLIWDITTTMDLTLIERRNLRKSVNRLFTCGMSHNEFGAKVTAAKFGNSERSSLSLTDGVQSTSPTTENWLRKLCTYSMNSNTSDEDKHDTNHINNKYNEMNVSVISSSRHAYVRFFVTSSISLSTSTCPSPSSSILCPWCTLTCTPTSTTWTPWKITCTSPPAYDVSVSLTGFEPNFMAFSELNDTSGSFFYITPSSDVTLGKLRTEAHRGQADYRNPEGVSVSQSSLSVVSDRTGKPVGERNVDLSIGFGVTRNTYSAHSKFFENTQAEKMVDGSGKLVGENISNAQIRTLFDEQRQMIITRENWSSRTPSSSSRRRTSNSTTRTKASAMGFREVHQQSLIEMEEYENSKVLPSIRSQDGSSL